MVESATSQDEEQQDRRQLVQEAKAAKHQRSTVDKHHTRSRNTLKYPGTSSWQDKAYPLEPQLL